MTCSEAFARFDTCGCDDLCSSFFDSYRKCAELPLSPTCYFHSDHTAAAACVWFPLQTDIYHASTVLSINVSLQPSQMSQNHQRGHQKGNTNHLLFIIHPINFLQTTFFDECKKGEIRTRKKRVVWLSGLRIRMNVPDVKQKTNTHSPEPCVPDILISTLPECLSCLSVISSVLLFRTLTGFTECVFMRSVKP